MFNLITIVVGIFLGASISMIVWWFIFTSKPVTKYVYKMTLRNMVGLDNLNPDELLYGKQEEVES